jgi:pimeloyl-ACP methyl ester carboxylesterase
MVPGLVHESFTSFDGTRIAYQARGPVGAPVVVLANGLGGTFEAFRHIYAALGDRYRILCWDYRGLYRSERPRDLATLAIPEHCRDLERLLDVERVDRAMFIGWSMGVQVNFEFFRHHRRRMRGIVVINGTYGTPFRTAMASRLARYVIPPALSAMKARAAMVSAITRRAVAWDGLVPTIVRLGLASQRIDADALRDVAGDFQGLDFALYADQLRRLGEHDARDLLPQIDVPVLIITGDNDLMTPVFTARRMNRKIAGSRLLVLRGGSHYTPIEFPDEIGREVDVFAASLPADERAGAPNGGAA